MIGSVSASRRAHAFAQLLEASRLDAEARREEASAGGSPAAPKAGREASVAPVDPAEQQAEQAAMVTVVHRLTALPRPALSAEVKAAQRARLMAELQSAPACGAEADPGAAQPSEGWGMVPEQRRRRAGRGAHRAVPASVLNRLRPRTRLTKGLAAGGLTMGVAAGALGGAATASTDALPGDTLYGLKRGMEDLRLDLTSGEIERGKIYLDHAATRLNEARRLMERGRAGQLDQEQLDEVRHALSNMRDDASEGRRLLTEAYEADGSVAPMHSLSDFADRHSSTWADLRERLPIELSDVSSEVSGVFDAIEADLAAFEPLLPREPRSITTADGPAPDPGASRSRQPDASQPPAEPAGSPGQSADPSRSGEASSEPSTTPSQGLLGEAGLLDTGLGAGSSQRGQSSGSQEPLAEPHITVPPLVEDLLPDLGLGGEQSQRPDDTSGPTASGLP